MAFGLEVDCKDISQIVNYGTPSTLEELIQETGTAGRNGGLAEAILYHKVIGKKIIDSVKQYGENQTSCRRLLLFKNFLFHNKNMGDVVACKRCDLCAQLCTCKDCNLFVINLLPYAQVIKHNMCHNLICSL